MRLLLPGGVQLARGYFRRPDLTAQRFIANPYADADDPHSQLLYVTGDIVSQAEQCDMVGHD